MTDSEHSDTDDVLQVKHEVASDGEDSDNSSKSSSSARMKRARSPAADIFGEDDEDELAVDPIARIAARKRKKREHGRRPVPVSEPEPPDFDFEQVEHEEEEQQQPEEDQEMEREAPRGPPRRPPEPDAAAAAAAVGDPENVLPDDEYESTTVPEKLYAEYFQNYEELYPCKVKGFCTACFFAIPANKANQPIGWANVLKYKKENRGLVPPDVYVRAIQVMYRKEVQAYLVNSVTGERYFGPGWAAKEIWEHDIKHIVKAHSLEMEILESNMWIYRSIRDYSVVTTVSVRNKRTGAVKKTKAVDVNQAQLMIKIGKETQPLINRLKATENMYLAR